jgi:hypothetical protein
VDAEHATDYEFTCWLRWNGVLFNGLTTWTFDARCAVINYALQNGVKLRLVTSPSWISSEDVSELFTFPEAAPQLIGSGNVVNIKPPDDVA